MDATIPKVLATGGVIDITTTGRRTGQARRIEIVVHNIDGRLYITGMPRHADRAWLLNLRDDPRLTVHVKGTPHADLPALAREVTDEHERRAIFEWVTAHAWQTQDPDAMLRWSPLIEVTLTERAA